MRGTFTGGSTTISSPVESVGGPMATSTQPEMRSRVSPETAASFQVRTLESVMFAALHDYFQMKLNFF